MTANGAISVDAGRLGVLVAGIFAAVGVDEKAAGTVARALVDADLEGQHSHGVMLVDMYVDRIECGSVSLNSTARIVSDNKTALVLDAGNALGHVTGDQAMALACERALEYGLGMVTVRNGFHFGTARRFAAQATKQGLIGVVMCNTRPLMPAPGGAQRLVGNNPLSIGLPTNGDFPIILDMATSEAAMGKIRMAAKTRTPIPPGWASDAGGTPTTDAEAAISGMLLPAGGPKGFGLAFVIDLLCGLLSSGEWGDGVSPLYGDPARPYGCSHLFLSIDPGHFGDASAFCKQAQTAVERVHNSARAPGTDRLFVPGEPEWDRRQMSGGIVALNQEVAGMLDTLARKLDVPLEDMALSAPKSDEALNHAKA